MDEQTKEQRFRRALAEYASAEVSASRDLWPAVYRRLQRRRRRAVLNLTMPAPRPRWSVLAAVTAVLLILGIVGYVLPATLGNYLPPYNPISPARTYAATYIVTYSATAIVRTTTPLPSSGKRGDESNPLPLAAQPAASGSLPMSMVEPPTPQPQPVSP